MKLKTFPKQALSIVFLTLTGFVFSALPYSYFIPQNKGESSSVAVIADNTVIYERPLRLKIPAINVDSIVEYVGVTPEGEMGVPENPINVAWFDLGPRPGENGSAIIAGHFGWRDNIPAVFDDLKKLKKGDKIYTEDEKGTVITFVVSDIRTYSKNDNASEVFVSKDGKSHLNLITCGGTWNKIDKSYSNRLVVFADKV